MYQLRTNTPKQKILNVLVLILQNLFLLLIFSYPILSKLEIVNLVQADALILETERSHHFIVDIYFITISIYFGWLVLEAIEILKTPVLDITINLEPLGLIDPNNSNRLIEKQLLADIRISKDFFNLLLGTKDLDRLVIEECKVNGTKFNAKWINTPEPIDYSSLNKDAKLLLDPSKVPNASTTYITELKPDKIILCWVSNEEYYLADNWSYHNKTNGTYRIDKPICVEISLRDNNYSYNCNYNFCSRNNFTFITRDRSRYFPRPGSRI